MADGAHEFALSRQGLSAIGGKQTAPLKTLVSDEVKTEVTKFWREKGYDNESDFLRELVLVTVYGPDFLTDLHRQRIQSLVRSADGIVPEVDR